MSKHRAPTTRYRPKIDNETDWLWPLVGLIYAVIVIAIIKVLFG